MSQRIRRVADTLRAEIATILLREMKDPRVQLATITEVRVSRDLSHAKVFVSVLGDDSEREGAIETLKGARGFVRSRLAGRVRTRTVPELHFELDRGAEHSQHIGELLATLAPGNPEDELSSSSEVPTSAEDLPAGGKNGEDS